MEFQATLKTPFGVLGIRCSDSHLTGIEFLPPRAKSEAPRATPRSPQNALAAKVCEQLSAYLSDPDFRFDLPLAPAGTAHQNKVWAAMRAIPPGKVRTYGEIAARLHSSPLAVGQACGANPYPIVIPCHRVVGKSGLGGFANQREGYLLDIKRWLLTHEGAI